MGLLHPDKLPSHVLEELDEEQLEVRKSMLETDGARHFALRRLLQMSPATLALA